MQQYDFSPLQEVPGKIIFPIILRKTKGYKFNLIIITIILWIIIIGMILMPIFEKINGQIDNGLFNIARLFGVPILLVSIYIMYHFFKHGGLWRATVEIWKDRLCTQQRNKYVIIRFSDIKYFQGYTDGTSSRSSPFTQVSRIILTLTNSKKYTLEGFNKQLADFMSQNFSI